MKNLKSKLEPKDWGMRADTAGILHLHEFKLADLAQEFGTPLYVLDKDSLMERAAEFRISAEKFFDGHCRVFFPFKCNSVREVISCVKEAGLCAEVMTEYELQLALFEGFDPENILVNGPCKSIGFLRQCLENRVGGIVIDSITELSDLAILNAEYHQNIHLLLRINPDFIPKGLNKNSATGGKHCSLGLCVGDVPEALSIISENHGLCFDGIHMHIGTGIRQPAEFCSAIEKLYPLFGNILASGMKISVLDVGGGFASMTTREFSAAEMATSMAFNSHVSKFGKQEFYTFDDYMSEIERAVMNFFHSSMPVIYFEPGRCIASPAQTLLLKINRIKERDGIKWLITDGGLGTITLPTYYEYHEVFLCNGYDKEPLERVTLTGPCCFASDIIYKNKLLPETNEGDIIAIMDTGAYFNAFESSFNFNKPAIVSVTKTDCRIERRRETFSDMIERDLTLTTNPEY